MGNWGGLNPALNAWRNGISEILPDRSTTTDGGYADPDHGSKSEHQPDIDGHVDAFDMDVNVFDSSTPTGTKDELKIIEALKKDFEADPRAHLWIHNHQIAQHDDRDWYRDPYGGPSPHTEHVHWESHEHNENDGSPWAFTHTIAVLDEMGRGPGVSVADVAKYFEEIAEAVKGSSKATSAGRTYRDAFAAGGRFTAGLNYKDQNGANMGPGRFDKVDANIAALSAAVAELAAAVAAIKPPCEGHPE